MKYLLFAIPLICLASTTLGAPPVPPKKEDLVKGASLIAVVRITNVVERVTKDQPSGKLIQTAYPEIEQVLRGTSPKKLCLERWETLGGPAYQSPGLAKGRFLAFLKGQGDDYIVGWDSLFPIEGGQVYFYQAKTLDDAVIEIKKMLRN